MPTKAKPAAKKAAKKAAPATPSKKAPAKKAPAKKAAAAPARKPSPPAKPAKATKPTKPAKPAKPAKAEKAAQPAKVTKSAKPEPQPAKASKAPAPRETPKAAPKAPARKAPPASPVKKPVAQKPAGRPFPKPTPLPTSPRRPVVREEWTPDPEIPMAAFIKKQKTRLLELKDTLVDSVAGMASETLRSRAEGSEASAFGMHQADAGSDAYDRDFALSLLSKEQDALYEIEEALKRIEQGTYGVCEMSGEKIPQARLEARPFARFTVDCQAEYEREVSSSGGRRSVRSLFGLMDSEDDDEDEEDGGKETVEKSDD